MARRKQPIFKKILFPILILVIIEILILMITFFGQGLTEQLRRNERKIIEETVVTRKTYLEGLIVRDWMDVDSTATELSDVADELIADGKIDLATLDDSSDKALPYLLEITEPLIKIIRNSRLSGAYVILNTDDLTQMQAGGVRSKPGLYFRDQDPTGLVSENNGDIFVKVSPSEVSNRFDLASMPNKSKSFRLNGENSKFLEFLSQPYNQAFDAYKKDEQYKWENLGYWGIIETANEEAGEEPLISYTIPIVLGDGTPIGVLGVDITFDYLEKLLPSQELNGESNGAYYLAKFDGNGNYLHGLATGNTEEIAVKVGEAFDETANFVHYESLGIYNSNTPFSDHDWRIVGAIPQKYMYAEVEKMNAAFVVAAIIALLVSVVTALLITYNLQKPIAKLSKEVLNADVSEDITLTPTGITEIDYMSDSIGKLHANIIANGKKFSQIMRMANKRIAGYAIDTKENSLFLTANFFEILGREVDQNRLSVAKFEALLAEFDQYIDDIQSTPKDTVYHIPFDGQFKYVTLRIYEDEGGKYGFIEDLTEEILEKHILQHERDHDALTNMYNRRAFRRELYTLFENAKRKIGVGALLMVDLDNLKYVNDTYGHDYGDKYIMKAAEIIQETVGGHSITARISGDEFAVFLYGYNSKNRILEKISALQREINSRSITLPDGREHSVHATGGVAWYPNDSLSMDDLAKYADYAMYMAKQVRKRSFINFDKTIFQSQEFQLRNSALLTKMVEDKLLHYAFQPIFDAKSGEVFAFEALLRPDVGEHFTVREVMETARRDGKLNLIEELTWSLALEAFDGYVASGRIPSSTYLFVNSIPNQVLAPSVEKALLARFKKYARQLVMELTEDEQVNSEAWGYKMEKHRSLGGKIALDDYGAGYNSEKTLLDISPEFVKVDISIVRGIHLSHDKQTIMEYITHYAHERGKFIIAEGVETPEEMAALAELGVDYVQGYLFAKPQQTPEIIPPERILALIQK